MNALWALVHQPAANRVGWVLLHSLWEGALIGLGFAVLRFALRKQSAQSRYLAGCVCLTLIMAAPLLTLFMAPSSLQESSGRRLLSSASTPISVAEQIYVPQNSYAEGWAGSAIEWVALFLGQLAPWLAVAWLAGVALYSCKLLRSFWRVRTMRTKETDVVGADLIGRLNHLRHRLSISRPVRLLKSALVEVPTVIGWLRPVILLPASTLAGLTPGQLEAILVHELAHVRRFDYLINAFQCVIETLMFYHPVVWWISRCVREEREHCCDDLVIEVCGNRLAYARALATLEELRAETPQFAFAASGGSLLNRVRRLLGASDGQEPIRAKQLGGIALIGVGVLFILLGVHLSFATAMYRASVRIKVERETSAQVGSENGKFTLTVWDPYFAQNLLEELRSETVLREVINNLGLSDEWGKRYNLAASPQRIVEVTDLLRKRITVQPIRNTMLFEISCLSEKPDEAKAIANGIADAYRNYRLEQRQKSVRVAMKSLERRAAEQEDLIHKAQADVDRLGEELNIPVGIAAEQAPAETVQNLTASSETLRKLAAMRIELEGQIMREETLLAGLKSLSRDKLIYALPTAAPDTLLTSFLEQKSFAEQALIVKRKDFGEEHSEVVKLKNQVEHLTTRLNERVDGILLGLDQRLSSEKEQLNKLIKEVDAMKQDDVALAQKSRPYFEARRKLNEAERFGQALTMKIASETIEATLPKATTMEILDAAVTPFRPVYPNRPKAAALILLGILLDFAGLSMMRTKPPFAAILQPA